MSAARSSLPARILAQLASFAPVRHAVRPFRRGRATVFLFHRADGAYDGIRGHRPEEIRSVLTQFRRHGIQVISLEQVVAAARGETEIQGDAVAFTMDDGYGDQADVLAPVFIEQDCPVTLFVITGLIDGTLWPWDAKVSWLARQAKGSQIDLPWGPVRLTFSLDSTAARRSTIRELQAIFSGLGPDRLPERLEALAAAVGCSLPDNPPPEYRPTNWDRLRDLENGVVRVAPHTVSHSIISRLPRESALWEMTNSLARVRSELQHGLPYLAWPVGKPGLFGPRDLDLAKEAGFAAAFAAGDDYTDLAAIARDPARGYSLERFSLPESAIMAFRYATGMEAARRSIGPPHFGRFGLSRRSLGRSLKRLATPADQDARGLAHLRRIDPAAIRRLVFVCKGNVCRSPYAAVLAGKSQVSTVSCGLSVRRQVPADMTAIRTGLARGLDISAHRSSSIDDVELGAGDCLVVMEPDHAQRLDAMARLHGCQVTLLGLWSDPPHVRIPDPYGRPPEEFRRTFDMIDRAVGGLIRGLR